MYFQICYHLLFYVKLIINSIYVVQSFTTINAEIMLILVIFVFQYIN